MVRTKIIFSPLQHAFAAQHEQFQRAFDVLRSGIDQRAFPGASIAITHRGRLVAWEGLGRFTYEGDSFTVRPITMYDLASVTKVVAGTTACMVLYERGIFHLEQKIAEVLPEFANKDDSRRQAITFQMLLAHSSGLPAYVKLFDSSRNKDELVRQAAKVSLVAGPGSHAEYSDIGFILLGVALERLAQEPLDKFCYREIFAPLGLGATVFNPPPDWKTAIPPTVHDSDFRHRVIQGEVHDENAWVMGGISGHAGVFATAQDVSMFTHCMLSGGAPLVRQETVQLFTHRQPGPAGSSRALGWDTPSHPSQSGRYFSASSYGHLGYTGTSLWVDPERQLSVTLLTNRTWPDRQSQKIKEIRPAFHDAVIEALT